MKQSILAVIVWQMCFCDPYGAEQHLKDSSQTQVLGYSFPLSGDESQGALSVGKKSQL